MADTADHRPDSGIHWNGRAWAAMLAFVAAVHLAWWLVGDSVVHAGDLTDGDGYARLVRVERLIDTGAWFDSSLPRANWPDGGSLHWTRPFDVLLLGLALPLAPLLGIKGALYWSGALISPLLHLGAAAALAWAAAPLVGRAAALIAGGLTAIQVGVLGYALIGHADHHVLLGLLAVVAFGFVVRALAAEDTGVRPAMSAGATLAAGIWVGTEMQIPMALAMLAVGVPWLMGEAGAGERSLALALGMVVGLVVALLVERGPAGFFAVEHDRVSVVHLAQAVMIAAFWSAVASLRRRNLEPTGTEGRLVLAVAGAALTAALMRALFPKILVNPLKDFDPVVLEIFDGIKEYTPIDDPAHAVLYLGVVLFAAPWAARRLRDEWPGRGRWPWALALASVVLYAALALAWVRWSFYAGLFSVVALADLMVRLDARLDRRLAQPGRAAVKVAAMTLLAAGPLAAGTAWVHAGAPPSPAPLPAVEGDPRGCPLQPLARVLNAPPWNARPRAILTSANFGPEILYRTRHRVTATLHHRNAAGLLASVRMLGGADDAENLKMIEQYQVDLVVVCPHASRDAYGLLGSDDDALARRLMRGDGPPWLAEVALPPALDGRFRMFEVRPR